MTRRVHLIAASAVAVVEAIYFLRVDSAAGLMVDDAWYIVLAKSLSELQGYRLISSAVVPIMPNVPPGFPALLSIVYAINPSFPDNVWWLKFVSIAAMFVTGVATYLYFSSTRRMQQDVAFGIACAVVLMPAFVFLATSTVMAECVFTLAQLLAIWWIDRAMLSAEPDRSNGAVVAGIFAAAAMLVRSAGAAAVLGIGVFLLYRRAWKPLMTFGFVVALLVLPWLVYSARHAPSAAEVEAHGGTIAYPYGQLFAMNRPGDPAAGSPTATGVVERIGRNAMDIFGRGIGGMLVPAFFRGPEESGEEVLSLGGPTGFLGSSMGSSPATVAVSLVLSAAVVVGFVSVVWGGATAAEFVTVISLLVILAVPGRTFRYVLPLAPFLLLYAVRGTAALTRNRVLPATALMLVIGFQLFDHTQYLWLKATRPNAIVWLGDAREAMALAGWMKINLPAHPVASTNPGFIYLYTGFKTVATDEWSRGWKRWQGAGIQFIAAVRPVAMPPKRLSHGLVYRSQARPYWVVVIGAD